MANRDTDISTNISSVTDGTAPFALHYEPMTLEEEALNGGWTRVSSPQGTPPPITVVGTRGDPDFDSDQTLQTGVSGRITDRD